MRADIPCIQSDPNFFVNAILIWWSCSRISATKSKILWNVFNFESVLHSVRGSPQHYFHPLSVHNNAQAYYNILIIKANKMHYFWTLFLVKNSICFGQTYCPSSGVSILYSIPTSLADNQHNHYDKYQLLWIQH